MGSKKIFGDIPRSPYNFFDFSFQQIDGFGNGDFLGADPGAFEVVDAAPGPFGVIELLQSLHVLFVPGVKNVAEGPY